MTQTATIQHHPVAQIGSREHRLCRLSDTRGIVRGVSSATPGKKHTTVDAVEGCDYLPQGETRCFKDGAEIEILEFDSDNIRTRGVFYPYIRPIHMRLLPGASLTGPIVWRVAPETREPTSPSDIWTESRTANIVMASLLALMFAGLVYASIVAALMLILMLGGAAFMGWAKHAIKISRFNRIAKFGSGYVLAPEKKFWV